MRSQLRRTAREERRNPCPCAACPVSPPRPPVRTVDRLQIKNNLCTVRTLLARLCRARSSRSSRRPDTTAVFKQCPEKGALTKKEGGGGHAQRRYFFFRRNPFVNAFVVRSRHSSYFITFYRRRGTAVRALFFVAGSHVMRTPTLGQNHDRYAPPCRSVTSTSLLASLLASSCLIFFM